MNLFIYLTAKVYTHEFFSAKRPRKLIPANVFEATRRPRVLSTVRNMCVPCGFYPLGLLSAGAFIRWGFYPLGPLSVGAFIRGAFFGGAFVRGAFVRGAFFRATWYPNLTKTLSIKLQRAQNKCIRFCLNLDNRAHLDKKEFKDINWLPVK